jgi:pimeloyl-ACP methyl ester carboxylesterase
MTKVGMPYVGRLEVYQKGEANILFVLAQLKKRQPNADDQHLTLVGHSNGGDIAMYCAKRHPELVSKIITLDILRVPFVLSNNLKILSFRSQDPNFKTDPGVLPTPSQAKADAISIIKTQFQHTDMSDRGPVCRATADSSDARSVPEQGQQQRARTRTDRQPDRFQCRRGAALKPPARVALRAGGSAPQSSMP